MCGYHVYQGAWKPSIGETLVAKGEFNNPKDKHAMKVIKGDETVSHLPRKELLNLYLLKVFSSVCDNNEPVYSLLNQWSLV